jgi:biotin carboxylase
MRHVVFVVPFVFETSLRFLRGALSLPDTAVTLLSQDSLARFDERVRGALFSHHQVPNALDPGQLAEGVRAIERQTGRKVERLLGVLEQLQEPLAEARAALGLPGLGRQAAHWFRDKGDMKDRMREMGLPCAKSAVATTAEEARAALAHTGLPVVVKPPAGAGAQGTYRLDEATQLDELLGMSPPSPERPLLIEEFIQGEEHSFDAVVTGGRCVWHSISRYAPSPLEVLRNDWVQWTVLLPREIDGPEYAAIREAGPAALSALGLEDGMAHMEWFRRKDGSVAISEVGARPPGAQFTTLLSVAHDTDMYRAWCNLVVHDVFDPPPRKYAAGAAYLRGQGSGEVIAVRGLDEAQQELGDLVVDVKLPRRGQNKSASYEGEGFVILRHPETEAVADGLARLVQLIRVELG